MQQRRGDKRRLGEIFVAIGAITQRELDRQLRFQVEEVVFEVMSWNEGYFSFVDEPETKAPTEVMVRIPVEALLMEGARRIDEWSRIENRIPHVGVVPSLAPPPEGGGGELDLLPPEWEVLALIDGARSVRALATELGRSDFEVAKTLFGLESAGVIVLMDPGSTRRGHGGATSAADFTELVARAERALQAKDLDAARAAAEQAGSMQPHEATIHLLLGRVHLAQGNPSPAAEAMRRALRLDPLLAAAHRQLGSRSSRWAGLPRRSRAGINGACRLAQPRRGSAARPCRARAPSRPGIRPWLTTSARVRPARAGSAKPRLPAARRGTASQRTAGRSVARRGEWLGAASSPGGCA
jgi:hypothetical protein